MILNLTQQFAERIKIPKDTVVVGDEPNKRAFDIIALKGDYKELVENAADTFECYNLAATYGLRDGLNPLVTLDGATDELVKSIYEDDKLPDDIVSIIAQDVLILSGMDDLIPSDDEEIDTEDEIELPAQLVNAGA